MGDEFRRRRQELAASLFNQKAQKQNYSLETNCDVGTFTQDGQVQTTAQANDGKQRLR